MPCWWSSPGPASTDGMSTPSSSRSLSLNGSSAAMLDASVNSVSVPVGNHVAGQHPLGLKNTTKRSG